MKLETEENVELLRTEENYLQDVERNNMTATGVKKWSIFNTLPCFHVVNGTANDLPHDLLEGVLCYSYKVVLSRLYRLGRYIARILLFAENTRAIDGHCSFLLHPKQFFTIFIVMETMFMLRGRKVGSIRIF